MDLTDWTKCYLHFLWRESKSITSIASLRQLFSSFSAVWVIFCEKLLWKQSALCTAVKAKYYLQIVPNVLQTNFFMNRNCQTCQLLYSITKWHVFGVGDHDITEFDITESDVTFFQEFDITESDITEKGNFYNGIRYNGICYNMKLEIGITKFVTVESDITGKWKLI